MPNVRRMRARLLVAAALVPAFPSGLAQIEKSDFALTSITVADGNRKTSEGESVLALAPLDLKAMPCKAQL